MKGFRNKMAESIINQGDLLFVIEKDNESDVQMWLIRDHESYGDPFGRADQYQVWNGDKRCYVGSNKESAYADYRHQIDEFVADWALI